MHRKQAMGEIVDKTKGKIKQALGDPGGNKRRKVEGERDERQANSRRVEGCETRSQRKNPKLTQLFNKKRRKLPWIVQRS
jgi:uncharacterized protein YjbJ (UPF0337 family)